jgi:hypothetical protein
MENYSIILEFHSLQHNAGSLLGTYRAFSFPSAQYELTLGNVSCLFVPFSTMRTHSRERNMPFRSLQHNANSLSGTYRALSFPSAQCGLALGNVSCLFVPFSTLLKSNSNKRYKYSHLQHQKTPIPTEQGANSL